MEFLNPFNEPIDPETDYFTMPTRVILEPHDNEDAVMDSLEQRYTRLIEDWRHQELEQYQSRETRYEHEQEPPSFPMVVRTVQQSARALPAAMLPEGRRARLLDANRVQTQCGAQEILLVSAVQQTRRKPHGTRLCPSCGGKHLTDRPSQTASPRTAPASIPCRKCQSNLASSSYWDGPDTLVCLHCGTRVSRPLAPLSQEEESANA